MTLIADNAAGHYLWRGMANKVFFGADRVAANGDVANKIGTNKLAVVAHENDVPVYFRRLFNHRSQQLTASNNP